MTMLTNIAGASSAIDPYATKERTQTKELDRQAFLNLLMAQLQHQDPLNPMEDKEFTAQLAQFSSLEQLNSINDGIKSLNAGSSRQDMLGAVSFIGKDIRAYGSSLSKEGGEISKVYYELEEPVADMYINIYDSYGALVHTEKIGARQAGSYEFTWSGKDANGNQQPDGVYGVGISAENTAGAAVLVYTEVSGTVSGVSSEAGVPMLRLSDGRSVNFFNIKEIVGNGSSTAGTGDSEDNEGDA